MAIVVTPTLRANSDHPLTWAEMDQNLSDLAAGINAVSQQQEQNVNDFGFKAMKQNAYTGASTMQAADNGKAHFKTDSSAITVPNSLDVTHLSTIINYGSSPMSVTFSGAVARLQGSDDFAGYSTWTLAPYNTLNVMKVVNGGWLISGKATPV